EYEQALQWYEKARLIREKILGKDHPKTASSYNGIATVYSRMGEYEQALQWYEKALVIQEKVLEKKHPDTAFTYNDIALVYSNMGEYEKALILYQQAYKVIHHLVPNHPNTQTCYNNMFDAYLKSGLPPADLQSWLSSPAPD
ncbi:MAG: tetratricopeptide repeat-containing protein, partial [Spirochaetaceae bacterium]|nr:tetratricopeptide repeat-containing protein [Spirochaetaceae bacterium]